MNTNTINTEDERKSVLGTLNTDLVEGQRLFENHEQIPNAIKAQKATGGKYRICNQKLMLTYKTHLNKDELKSHVLSYWVKTVNNAKARIEIAHESGDKSNPYPHTHVVIDFGAKLETTNARYFDLKIDNEDYILTPKEYKTNKDIEGIHPNIGKILTPTHWLRCLRYLAKEDPENKHLLQETIECIPLSQRVWDCKSLAEAQMKYIKKASDVSGIKSLYNDKPKELEEDRYIEPLYFPSWQDNFLNKLYVERSSMTASRTVFWIHDKVGNVGKTNLCNHMKDKYPKSTLVLNNISNAKDIATVVENALAGGWNGDYVFIDLPRTAMKDDGMYETIECLKNRSLTVTKYSGKELNWREKGKSTMVVIMANFLPYVYKLSIDRWRIYEVGQEEKEIIVHNEESEDDNSEEEEWYSDDEDVEPLPIFSDKGGVSLRSPVGRRLTLKYMHPKSVSAYIKRIAAKRPLD